MILGGFLLLAYWYFAPESFMKAKRLELASRYALPILASLSVLASLITLYYSEILGLVPCGLCWLERTMLYPSAIMLSVAAYLKDRSILRYVLILSIIGAVIALYHHYLQVGGTSVLPCPASGNGDCAKRVIFEFGFVTFPLMAFAIFFFTGAAAKVAMAK